MKSITLIFAVLLTTGCNGREPAIQEGSSAVVGVALERDVPEPDSTTLRLFNEAMEFARENDLHERPMGEIMTILGKRFAEAPYEAGMLDVLDEEKLICRLDAFDCVTFVESTLAMARAVKNQDTTYRSWANYMRDQRYRGGEQDGYCSRLHYFTEWILDNEQRGTVENITKEIGGIPLEKDIDFMTEHRESYPRFAENDSLFQCIREMEATLQSIELYYIPEDGIRQVYDQLKAGDILALATNVEGLDVSHTGLVYDNGDGTKGLLHASTSDGVTVSPDLQAYVQGVDIQIGIIVARPQEPARS